MPDAPHGKGGDHSVAQFAVLGLRAAQRRGVEVPEATWRAVMKTFVEGQHNDGWGYHPSNSPYGSMTAAGICSIALSQWALKNSDPTESPEIERALDWMGKNYSVASNPKTNRHNWYWMYSAERTGRILDREFFGTHEWYPLGARHLVGAQQENGGWVERDEWIVPTAFALLFLTRATESLEIEEPKGPGRLVTDIEEPEPEEFMFIPRRLGIDAHADGEPLAL